MNNKLSLIIKREYLAKIRNRSFVIMTFLSPILMVALILLIAFLVNMNGSEKKVVAVLNESSVFKGSFENNDKLDFVQFRSISLEEAKDSTLALGYYGLLHLPKGNGHEAVSKGSFLYLEDNPPATFLEGMEDLFKKGLRRARLSELGLSADQFQSIEKDYKINTGTFGGKKYLKGINEIKYGIGAALGYLLMMFIVIYGGFVMRSVIEEKTSRIIEVIVSSVKPFQLMLGKIIGTSLAGITQFVIWVVSASLLMLVAIFFFGFDLGQAENLQAVNGTLPVEGIDLQQSQSEIELYLREMLNIPWAFLLGCFIVYFILGYLIYSSIYAAIGAAVDNETDTQQFIFPVILPLIIAIYVGFFSVFGNPHSPLAVSLSLFPLTSPIVMLMRLPGGLGGNGVPIWQFVMSIVFLIMAFLAIVWLAARIYRVGILMHGKKPSYKELYKWLKY